MAEIHVDNLPIRLDLQSANTLLALLLNMEERPRQTVFVRQDIARYGPLPGEPAAEHSHPVEGTRTMTAADGFLARVTTRAQQWLCGLQGHDSLLHFERGRMSLLCASCGHETPGWEVGGSRTSRATTATAPARRERTAPAPRVVHLPVREQQVA